MSKSRNSNQKRKIEVEASDPLFENADIAEDSSSDSELQTVIYYLQKIDEKLSNIDKRVGAVEKLLEEMNSGDSQKAFVHQKSPKKVVPKVTTKVNTLNRSRTGVNTAPLTRTPRSPRAVNLNNSKIKKNSPSPEPPASPALLEEDDQIDSKLEEAMDEITQDIKTDDEPMDSKPFVNDPDDSDDEPLCKQEPQGTFELPCKSEDDVSNLEIQIRQNQATYDGLVEFLVQVSFETENYKRFINNCLRVIFDEETALLFNWTGRGEKGRTQVSDLHIVNAIRDACLTIYDNLSQNEIAITMRRWFAYAEQRIKRTSDK